MNKYRGNRKIITAAVLASLLAVPGHSFALERNPEYVYYNGKPFAEMQFFNEGEGVRDETDNGYLIHKAGYTLDPSLVAAAKSGMSYWTGLIGPQAKNGQPWQVYVTTTKSYQNASAGTTSLHVEDGKTELDADNYVAKQLQGEISPTRMTEELAAMKIMPDGDYTFSVMDVGQYIGAARKGCVDGWWIDTDTVLPANEQAADYLGTVRHELGHALGIVWSREYLDANGEPFVPQSTSEIITFPNKEERIGFSSKLDGGVSWNTHLVDQNLNPAKPGMPVVSAEGFEILRKANPSLKKSDVFLVNNKLKGEDSSGRNGKAFFVGENVTDALAGATFYGVSGLPVNAWEKNGQNNYAFEGSHLQTTGMMSHRSYSNYTCFMEVELAVMQDMGYKIDREAYYGHSVYGNNGTLTNTQGYSARNAEGTAYIPGEYSAVPLGIGLHIYGSGNSVTQAADILTEGTGATGVRVDGMKNTLIIPESTNIHADGLRGNGILIAYGRGQIVDQAGTVTANGKGGVGARFDFGSSSNGAGDEYRGSYIRFDRDVNKAGEITSSYNLDLTKMDAETFNAAADELAGPMVEAYNLSGTLEGGEHAIYIGKNAFVKEINVNEGASVKGDIVSDWKHFTTDEEIYDAANSESDALTIQYNGNNYAYDEYIPDLVTNLNFNTDMVYDYNISGADNIKLNVKQGVLTYGGTADVVSVHVVKGAALLGGTYKVNDMSEKIDSDFTDDTTGIFRNCGTIGAADRDSVMSIQGELDSDGMLQGMAGGSAGTITVTGKANIDGSTAVADGILPGETFTVLTAGKAVTGTLVNKDESTAFKTGLLNETGAVKGTAVEVSAVTANNLNTDDPVQNETFAAMIDMDNTLRANNDSRRNEMRGLFSLSPDNAKKALSSISGNAAVRSAALAQRNTLTSRLLSARLTEAFRTKPGKVTIPVQRFTESNSAGTENKTENATDVSADGRKINNGSTNDGMEISAVAVEPAENNIWFKFGKGWGDQRGGADYHNTLTLLGWDKQMGKNWRGGLFAGYGQTSFSDDSSSNKLKDTRFGVYGGFHNAKSEGMVYLDYGVMRNHLRRSIAGLGLSTDAKYRSRILELGGEYLYDLQAEKNVPWHVRPYVNAQISRLWQKGYTEEGAGIFSQQVGSLQNNYVGAGLGVEFKRYLAGGSYAIRAGVKHAFSGADPTLRYGYLGNPNAAYDMRNVQDKTHFVLSIGGDVEVAKGWTVGGDATFERGSHDKDFSCSVTVKRVW